MSYRLYIGNKNYSSWSLRPWVLLAELNIPFEEQLEQFEDGGSFEKFRTFSPTGLVPCLVDGEQTVWESLAIVEYVAEQHASVWPADTAARAWARSAAAEMHAGFNALRNHCPMNVGLRITLNEIPEALHSDLARLDELWQQGLDTFGGPFLAGAQFTAVDAFFAPVCYRIQTYDLQISEPAQQYCQRILSTRAMQAWTTAALAETFREADHEVEFAALGTINQDLRAT